MSRYDFTASVSGIKCDLPWIIKRMWGGSCPEYLPNHVKRDGQGDGHETTISEVDCVCSSLEQSLIRYRYFEILVVQPDSPVSKPEAWRVFACTQSRVRKTAFHYKWGQWARKSFSFTWSVEGPHMQTKPIREEQDPWIVTAQLGKKFPKKNKLSSAEIYTSNIQYMGSLRTPENILNFFLNPSVEQTWPALRDEFKGKVPHFEEHFTF